MCTWSGGGDATSWTDSVRAQGTYCKDETMDEMEMWQAWWLLTSVRSWVAQEVSSPMAVTEGDLWVVDAGELMDGLEFPDISYLWKGQRGSWQKAA